MEEILRSSQRIYDRLQDEKSRWLFEKHVMWSLTGDARYADEITSSVLDRAAFGMLMKRADAVRDRLVIRGAGNDYYVIKKLYPELDFVLFVDNDLTKLHRNIDGKNVISPDEFYEKYADHYVLVNSMAANAEILAELKEHGITDEQILNLRECYEKACDKQYFEPDIMRIDEKEIFVDGGCYDGRTVMQFAMWCGEKYEKVYSFEPDPSNYLLAERRIAEKQLARINLINKGLWDERTELHFAGDGTQGSRITDVADTVIQTTTVDEAVKGDRVTFLKLDVEGAEYNALLGAKDTITKWHPKLAISIYHKPEDIFELPELILSMRDDYKFWLRHYQLSICETILYAV